MPKAASIGSKAATKAFQNYVASETHLQDLSCPSEGPRCSQHHHSPTLNTLEPQQTGFKIMKPTIEPTIGDKPKVGELRLGIDVGSTTVKNVAIDWNDKVIFSTYQRHRADIRSTIIETITQCLNQLEKTYGSNLPKINLIVTGSGGLALSQWLNVPFIQEVVAATTAVRKYIPKTDVAIELGGEDAKITYFSDTIEQRMNGTCAGGTGAFIDQMAALLETDTNGLNELAKKSTTIYPIAARCGVFAKTDIQPLINEGARREDIAASIYQAVVSQTISGLACGKPIRGNVAFLGGPLHFMNQLQQRFVKTLKLAEGTYIEPPNSQLFVALGAALSASTPKNLSTEAKSKMRLMTVPELRESLNTLHTAQLHEVRRLEPLFKNDSELKEFRERHKKETVPVCDIKTLKGPAFLGIDAGSTTTKCVLIDEEGKIYWQFYSHNGGNPVSLAVKILQQLYKDLPKGVKITRACSTGYGENLFKTALGVDDGEVETIAHYKAAEFFLPGVEFLLDIGGQDMKCLHMKDGAITSIQLNEACSSGCGSFLDNFARSLGLSIQQFSQQALKSPTPVDLGNRCTVFMNSRVKQAQKEGASVGDISAGLSYSVIKNALFKVIKLRNAKELENKKIVVQGGTFMNDAVLRAFEIIAGHNVTRPDIAGLMGAYGAALIARDSWKELGSDPNMKSSISTPEQLENFKVDLQLKRCGGCNNNCLLTINTFNDGNSQRKFITGNRCERGLERNLNETDLEKQKNQDGIKSTKIPNLFADKYKKLFSYKSLPLNKAKRGIVGIPRVLNMYENYPLWHTFFTKLGYRVQLSPQSNRKVYERGLESIPSESVCYPGKITHGHIESLLKKGIKFIFYPCCIYEHQEDSSANNHFNCPVVSSYSEVLKNNIDALRDDKTIDYRFPFIPLDNKKRFKERMCEEFKDIPQKEVEEAAEAAWNEQIKFKKEVQEMGEKALKEIEKNNLKAVVLAGRPYHLDPEINHGIPELVNSLGLAVLTEDSVAHLGKIERPLRVVDQWVYHNRLYRAAQLVSTSKNLELVQLTSFGCGLDAVTSDQVEEILNSKGKMYTLIKIDEGSNLGAVRIRFRSLIAAMKERKKNEELHKIKFIPKSSAYVRSIFDTTMKGYDILAPQMSPMHFDFFQETVRAGGYNFHILPSLPSDIEAGLQYVNNDACYPSLIVVGQLINAVKSGRYNTDKIGLLITQTGGGCRATNYIAFLRRALKDAGLEKIPVISLSMQGLEGNPGFKIISVPFAIRMLWSCIYGDVLSQCLYRTRPYELVPGSANALFTKLKKESLEEIKRINLIGYWKMIHKIVEEFDRLPLRMVHKPRIGVVGEVLVKFHPIANNDIVNEIEKEGAEAVVPGFTDFIFYNMSDSDFKNKKLSGPLSDRLVCNFLLWLCERFRWPIRHAMNKSKRFIPPTNIWKIANEAQNVLQLGHIMGEGWLLTAEMIELIKQGVPSVACLQPFACLPNHITGKGMIKELRRRYPGSNIAAIDYDPGASEVNQINRLKLLLANAPLGSHPDETKLPGQPFPAMSSI